MFHLNEANKTLRRAKLHADVAIIIEPIPISQLRFTCYTDASWANRYDLSSQGGYVILAHEKQMLDGKLSRANLIDWSSRKLQRVARSSLSAELQSNTNGIDNFTFLMLTWSDIVDNPVKPNSKIHSRQLLESQAMKWAGGLVVDHKGLYDIYAGKKLQLEEKRSQVEAKANLETLELWGIRCRWVAGCYQLANAMTKEDIRANDSLREFLRRNQWAVVYDPKFVAGKKIKLGSDGQTP